RLYVGMAWTSGWQRRRATWYLLGGQRDRSRPPFRITTMPALAGQREGIDSERKAIALAEIRSERGKNLGGDLDLLSTRLADQVMVVGTERVVLKIQLAIAPANRRNQSDALQPL